MSFHKNTEVANDSPSAATFAATQRSPTIDCYLARPAPTAADVQKLRVEIAHLDLLVKKLQTELQIERQYNQALETQIRTLTEVS